MNIVKNRSIIDKIMHFLVHNSLLFTVVIMGLVHATLLLITLIAGATTLWYFNILSVVVYAFCTVLGKTGHILPVYISIFVEVSIYAVISVLNIGWDCGSYYFLFSIVPIVIFFGCYIFKGSKRWIIVLMLTMLFATYMVLYIGFWDTKPVYEVSETIRMILTVFSAFAMYFSVVFYMVMYIYSSESEMNNLEEKNVKLSVDAQADALTGLLNRRGFLPIVDSLMEKGKKNHFCLAFTDIDNFKRINDSFGHDCGDEVLRHISELIQKEMIGCDICRWGGEEFIILMKNFDFNTAIQKMENIRQMVESTPTTFYNKRVATTITIGVEEFSDIYNEPEDIIRIADERMYYGKQHGKNIVIFESVSNAN
ncbi:MAG: GGDEF domain-containing protein [Lachnospiraceae bacterium]|nr:GGDEF domain-containing protein [Lachnospiraceae bacterium]